MSFEDQINLLKSRGMSVTDKKAAKEHLDRIGYYRLSGYWYSFRKYDSINNRKLDDFREGTHFSDAVRLYVFDKKLRLLALDALERIEVALRVDIAHLLGKHDTFAYKDGRFLDGRFVRPNNPKNRNNHANWLKKYDNLLHRSKETFITHFKTTHGLPLPIWVAIEILDFGAMSTLYSGLKGKDRNTIAQKNKVQDGRVLSSWLRALNYLRNICAHHSRLWNRNMVEQPVLPSPVNAGDLIAFIGQQQQIARPFVYFTILQWLMREICPNSSWGERFAKHLDEFPSDSNGICNLGHMGCPSGWQKWSLWQC